MDLLKLLVIESEKAANIARLCRQNQHLFKLLIEKKSAEESNPRFVQDFKTLADVLIQQMVKHNVGLKFPELGESVYGEETRTFRNTLGEKIEVEIKTSSEATASLLEKVLDGDREAAELLAAAVHDNEAQTTFNQQEISIPDFDIDLSDAGIWIDPIDSTAEYINGIEDVSENEISSCGLCCVTVLIGVFDKKSGAPLIGVINQPFFYKDDSNNWIGKYYWAAGNHTNVEKCLQPKRIVCVSSSEDVAIIEKLKKKGFETIEASGAGYKTLTVIKGMADVYVLSKDSTYQWDTCGPQAILNALGGGIVVFDDSGKSVRYNEKNFDEGNCNNGGIIAYSMQDVLEEIIEALAVPL